jgi:outer membrane protein OmpA-like peptidoglycan-associated protein
MIPDVLRLSATRSLTVLAGIGLVAATGCATKKHVRTTVQPIEQKVATLEQKSTENEKELEELDRKASKADETAKAAEQRAQEALRAAAAANEAAKASGEKAEEALLQAAAGKKLAEQGFSRLDIVEKQILGIDQYSMTASETVYFDIGKETLSAESKELLDGIAAKMGNLRRYVVEVQGFTDKSGDPKVNLELSRRRAEAVVRYLTVEHNVPMHRVSVLGMGAESPVADNKSRQGRKQNRRVEVRVYTAAANQQHSAQAR